VKFVANMVEVLSVNKVIRTAKDVKASAKDLSNFSDWLFANSFIAQDLYDPLTKLCNGAGKAPKKKPSEAVLNASTSQPPPMAAMPNGMVRPSSNPQMRAERAGKTLSMFLNSTLIRWIC
jgi:hypothetical protein